MRCELCASIGRYRVVGESSHVLPPSGPGECEVCGSPVAGPRDRVVETIAQLARFGLTGQMLLSRRGG